MEWQALERAKMRAVAIEINWLLFLSVAPSHMSRDSERPMTSGEGAIKSDYWCVSLLHICLFISLLLLLFLLLLFFFVVFSSWKKLLNLTGWQFFFFYWNEMFFNSKKIFIKKKKNSTIRWSLIGILQVIGRESWSYVPTPLDIISYQTPFCPSSFLLYYPPLLHVTTRKFEAPRFARSLSLILWFANFYVFGRKTISCAWCRLAF